MKRLFIVRHAKSSWGGAGLSDFERPLNERGKRDAPEIAHRLLTRKVKLDTFISSPAKRAKTTCKAFCKVYKFPEEQIIVVDELYEANPEAFNNVIRNINENANNVAIFGHNPGITDFVNQLCEGNRIDNMPTCSVFAVETDISQWSEFDRARKQFLFFEYPKAVS
jgi:phosphohistidine phosphatase